MILGLQSLLYRDAVGVSASVVVSTKRPRALARKSQRLTRSGLQG